MRSSIGSALEKLSYIWMLIIDGFLVAPPIADCCDCRHTLARVTTNATENNQAAQLGTFLARPAMLAPA